MRICLKYEGLGRLKKMFKLTRLPPTKAVYVLLRTYTLSVSDDTTDKRTYYWPPPSTEKVKFHSRG